MVFPAFHTGRLVVVISILGFSKIGLRREWPPEVRATTKEQRVREAPATPNQQSF